MEWKNGISAFFQSLFIIIIITIIGLSFVIESITPTFSSKHKKNLKNEIQIKKYVTNALTLKKDTYTNHW